VIRVCVDEDTSHKVAAALKRLRPTWDVVFARTWAGPGIRDELLLDMLWQDRRALISRDRATLSGWIKQRQAGGRNHAGVFFWDLERFPPGAFGALARAAAETMGRYRVLTNIVDTIR
jgi:hypothetical protein